MRLARQFLQALFAGFHGFADEALVFEQGRIVESGSFNELVQQGGLRHIGKSAVHRTRANLTVAVQDRQ